MIADMLSLLLAIVLTHRCQTQPSRPQKPGNLDRTQASVDKDVIQAR